jgi:hypothetical protein
MSHTGGRHGHHYSRTLDVNFLFISSSNLGSGVDSWAGRQWRLDCFLFFCFYDYTRPLGAWSGKQPSDSAWMDVFIAFYISYT